MLKKQRSLRTALKDIIEAYGLETVRIHVLYKFLAKFSCTCN